MKKNLLDHVQLPKDLPRPVTAQPCLATPTDKMSVALIITHDGVEVVEGRSQDNIAGKGGADEKKLDVRPERVSERTGLDKRIVDVPGTC
ncbi:hypothetical protein E2C01_025206 [Portunus trituberculatus]|uniref:Uncharacterized protein n=1 Tax=Portunus trituberculatus TaxID=210409 RepID=A0A5B7EFD2_PORTR|nr:hypothetical protein [Portunus trituberculatus]